MEDLSPRYPLNESMSEGRLQIRATTASEALPVADATVIVTTQGEPSTLLYSARTDQSGLTPEFVLPAPPASEGDAPGGVPFTEYEVYVHQERFRPIHFLGVPVFDGVTTVQPAALQPLSQGQGLPTGIQTVPAYTTQL